MKIPIEIRFWPKVNKNTDSGCWEWTASRTGAGYGQIAQGRTMLYAHRLAYEWLVGPIPDGLELDHLCRNRRCCNPDHLEPVTHGDNMRRGDSGKNMSAKTHCPKGHEYSTENTWLSNKGSRVCKACKANRQRVRRSRMKVAA